MRPKKPEFAHLPQLVEARQVDLVLHRGGLDARRLRGAHDLHRLLRRVGDRLFQVDVLAGRDRAQRALQPPAGRRDIEIDVDRSCRRASRRHRPTRRARHARRRAPRACPGCGRAAPARASSRSPFLSGSPPSLRIARIERIRCWLVPRRPVTPSIAMRSVLVAMILLLSFRRDDAVRRGGRVTVRRPCLNTASGCADLGDRLLRARASMMTMSAGLPTAKP